MIAMGTQAENKLMTLHALRVIGPLNAYQWDTTS
jgi:hypothetical protein